jgi:hypothetical protein
MRVPENVKPSREVTCGQGNSTCERPTIEPVPLMLVATVAPLLLLDRVTEIDHRPTFDAPRT